VVAATDLSQPGLPQHGPADILTAVLEDGGLTSLDFDLRLQSDYPSWEYVCQYRESHFGFLSRWMERTASTTISNRARTAKNSS
jgi:type VI secretion system secreted protein VgrG